MPNNPALNLVGDFTIEMWFNPHSYNGRANPWEGLYPNDWKTLISKGSYANNGPGEFTILLNPGAGNLNFYSDGNAHSAYLGMSLTLDRWYHMALVRTDGWVQFYLDGIPVGAPGDVPQDAVNTRDLWIGKNMGFDLYGFLSHQYAFDGSIDEVRIWNVARTQAEILAGTRSVVPEVARRIRPRPSQSGAGHMTNSA